MDFFKRISRRIHYSQISTKITITYALCFIALLVLTNVLAWLGFYYALYSQAEKTLLFSMENTAKLLEKIEQDSNLDVNSIRDPLVSGVVLRVVNANGEVFIDTDPHYITIDQFDKRIISDPPFWTNSDMEVARFTNALIYRAKMNFTHDDETVTLQFFRTITSQVDFFEQLKNVLIVIDFIGLILAVSTGYFISRKILRPISTMTKTAQEIAIESMTGRIPVNPVDDELNDLAKTFNNMLDRLQVGITQQQRFVSDASHELRTPATVIRGYSDVLMRWGAKDPDILQESIEAIHSEAENMQQLIEQLLFLARSDQKRQPLNMERLELSEIVEDVFHKTRQVVHSHEIKLIHNDAAIILADKITIRQMLRIFLDNAIKYTPSGGTITIDSVRDNGRIKLSVQDTGIGIAPENQQKVFERFYRVNASHSKQEVSGTGLGLSIAKWIAAQHNINIELESELNKGTTISAIIPTQS
ncbi:MAG: HAMP domain-containing protein [Selenomonadaceae bacterium]|nr:HAMP domain-containing protein [Selenomonadaceae bacterium]